LTGRAPTDGSRRARLDLVSVYLIEAGFPNGLPGFDRELASSLLPFWANYLSIDFALANFRHLAPEGCRIVLSNAFRGSSASLPSRNGGIARHIQLEGSPEGGLRELTQVLERDSAETVVIAPLSLVCIIDRDGLANIKPRAREPILKLSLDEAAVDVYVAQKTSLVKLLSGYLDRGRCSEEVGDELFGRVLHQGFDTIKNCTGTLLFQNNLMQLYRQNLWIVDRVGTSELAVRLDHLGEPRGAGKEVRIDGNGMVRNSYLGAGSVVDGLVESSVIFPDVVIGKDAVVYNSVVMNGNRIAPRAQLYKSLLLPYTAEVPKNTYNIGEGCSIGQKHSAATNFDHSNQIRDGLTVLGVNVEVPRGLTISAGCLLGAGVGAQQLKGIKEVRKGTSVLWNTDR
jgi:hypothetical protein